MGMLGWTCKCNANAEVDVDVAIKTTPRASKRDTKRGKRKEENVRKAATKLKPAGPPPTHTTS